MAKKKKNKMSMYVALLLLALLPMFVVASVITVTNITNSSNELKKTTHNSMLALTEQIGSSFNAAVESNKMIVKEFAQSPVILDYLKDGINANLANRAENYTKTFYEELTGWEGIYLANWNSKVLTHPNEELIRKVMREGDRLTELQDAMLKAAETGDGVYNAGVIESPASGKHIISMYAPIMIDDVPMGYIGAGTLVDEQAAAYSNVEGLGLSSAYVYFVSKDGTMLYHPDASKIGNPVENEAVKGVVSKLSQGIIPKPECVEYNYKGEMKYAAYCVSPDGEYVTIVTANESEALASITTLTRTSIIVLVVGIVIFVAMALLLTNSIVKPLKKSEKYLLRLSEGDMTTSLNTTSAISEIDGIVQSTKTLRTNLMTIVSEVSGGMNQLEETVTVVSGAVATCDQAKNDILQAVEGMANGASEMADSVQTTAERVTDIGAAIDTITENAKETGRITTKTMKVSNQAMESLDDLLESNADTVEKANAVAEGINESSRAVAEIEKATEMITSIASQTNLLSLNASIEAARAGEAGRGFAVVAGEISQLAQQSNQAAAEIKVVIGNVISASKKNTDLADAIKESVQTDNEVLQSVNAAFTDVKSSVDEIGVAIQNITEMTNSLNTNKQIVVEEITNLSSISEENAASSEETSASTQELGANIAQINGQTQEIVDVTENVKKSMEFFKL